MTIYSESQAAVLADLYHRFIQNPGSVGEDWQRFFSDLDDEAKAVIEKMNGGARGAEFPPSAIFPGFPIVDGRRYNPATTTRNRFCQP